MNKKFTMIILDKELKVKKFYLNKFFNSNLNFNNKNDVHKLIYRFDTQKTFLSCFIYWQKKTRRKLKKNFAIRNKFEKENIKNEL